MKYFIIILLLFPARVFAHPSIAIKFDSKGNLYYSDLHNVYKITPGGKKHIAVADVHTHEISIDQDDNVYGEHLWYEGDASKKWGHYVWKLLPDGRVTKVKDSTEGFLKNYGFLRDDSENVYFVERGETSVFKKIDLAGKISKIGSGKFENIRWQFVNGNGVVYFFDMDDLYRLTPDGKFTLLSKDMSSTSKAGHANSAHNIMGLWTDKNDNLYLANFARRQVETVKPNGEVKIIYTSNSEWSPTGGTFDKDGNLWLLEANPDNDSRITKVIAGKFTNIPVTNTLANTSWNVSYKTFLALIPILAFVAWYIFRQKKHDPILHEQIH